MDREAMKEMFRKEREEQEQYVLKNISEKPDVPGKYNVMVKGVRTIAPLFLTYDGNDWVNLKEITSMCAGDASKVSYYDKPPAKKLKM